MRKEKNTIKTRNQQKERKNNMKKLIMMFLVLNFTACASISDKAGKLKPNIGECPPQSERTLSDILCQEPK